MAMIIGYINASWTLKVDIAAEYICRLVTPSLFFFRQKNNDGAR
jgi:cation diffusion facilitator CzcD-associated flavoprotein CzcO